MERIFKNRKRFSKNGPIQNGARIASAADPVTTTKNTETMGTIYTYTQEISHLKDGKMIPVRCIFHNICNPIVQQPNLCSMYSSISTEKLGHKIFRHSLLSSEWDSVGAGLFLIKIVPKAPVQLITRQKIGSSLLWSHRWLVTVTEAEHLCSYKVAIKDLLM